MNMGDALRRNAQKDPHRQAVQDARVRLSYGDLNTRTNGLANSLLGLGLKKGDTVAVLVGNRTEHIETLFAIAKSGVAGLPIDPKWRGREIANAINFFDVAAIILEASAAPGVIDALSRVHFAGPLIFVDGGNHEPAPSELRFDYEKLVAQGSSREPDVEVGSADLFLIMITSGTTGFPKGCLSTHEKYVLGCINHALGGRGSGPGEVELLVSPLCFNSGRSSALGHLFWGGKVILKERFDPVDTLNAIQSEQVTYIALAPLMADRLLEARQPKAHDTTSLRCLRKAGSPFHTRTVKALIEQITPHIYQSYASTDAGSVSLLLPDEQLRKCGSSGRVIWAAEALIVDESGTPLPCGAVGEIICRGPLVCAGYYKNPEANQESFRDGWFFTGDLGRFDEDGYLYVVGRKKNMVKSGSISISPEEVQDVLQSHPAVKEAAVVGVPHDVWGEAVLAVVALWAENGATEQDLIEYCQSEIAPYKVPKGIRFLAELPHTELGKVATEVIRTRFGATFAKDMPVKK